MMRVATLFVFLAGCTALAMPRDRAPDRDDAAPLPSASGAEGELGVAYALDLQMPGVASPPSWFEWPTLPVHGDLGEGRVSIGSRHALHRTRLGAFMTSNRGPLVGPLPLPHDVTWAGFDEDDGLYLATRGGVLLRIERAEDAVDATQQHVAGEVPGATVWDGAGRFVIAAKPGPSNPGPHASAGTRADRAPPALVELWVSEDRGAHFTRRTLPGKGAARIVVRSDGLIAASIGDVQLANDTLSMVEDTFQLFVSRDAGRTWRASGRSSYELGRLGALIFDHDANGELVLDESGRARPGHAPCSTQWSNLFRLSAHRISGPEACFQIASRAPASGAAPPRVDLGCACSEQYDGLPHPHRRWVRKGFMDADERFAIRNTRTRFGMIDTSICETDSREPLVAASTRDSVSSVECSNGASYFKHASIGIYDAGLDRLRITALPPGLDPVSVLDAGGMAVVLARAESGHARVFVIDHDGHAFEETEASFQYGSLLRAADARSSSWAPCFPSRRRRRSSAPQSSPEARMHGATSRSTRP